MDAHTLLLMPTLYVVRTYTPLGVGDSTTAELIMPHSERLTRERADADNKRLYHTLGLR